MDNTRQSVQTPHCRSYHAATEDPYLGYRRLWAKYLLVFFEDLQSKNRAVRRTAELYFKASNYSGPGSLSWVCQVLNLDPETVRRHAKERVHDRTRWGDPCKKYRSHIIAGQTKRYFATNICVLCQAENNRYYKARAKNGG